MAEENKPVKGILKNSTSFDHDGAKDAAQTKKEREMKWDEMNILATYHPADKDYGHNKIDEPPTPYNHMTDEDVEHSGDEQTTEAGGFTEEVDPQSLASRLAETEGQKRERTISSGTEEEDDDENEEDHAKRKVFEQKRKMHYNEFHAVKLARQLLDDDEEDEDAKEADESTTL
ncbi:hypothetical protein CAPTEDRAFT_169726 [Capitella teleta]|uniref:Protein phosphatase inhibitor 2 n=1 Tax=Capitella teleta TaxID=283909 RepID=R7TFW7_CAPTE|nr:hypothetical protein CAPTEDRAFT_169726 [Capitella teleta]|eukprot:ELT92367.1 hypothetical protein CAPTEDRAFT_169726 [Capitella teleta]